MPEKRKIVFQGREIEVTVERDDEGRAWVASPEEVREKIKRAKEVRNIGRERESSGNR